MADKSKLKGWGILAVIAVLVIGFGYYFASHTTGKVIADGKYDNFAKALSEKGVKMYGASWCTHCKDQKDMFGTSWQYVDYVECASPNGGQNDICTKAGIEGYPTWGFSDGTKHAGVLSLEELSKLANVGLEG